MGHTICCATVAVRLWGLEGKPEKVFSRRGAAIMVKRERGISVEGVVGHRRTDLILDKPAGQLLRRAVSFPLEAPDEDSPVDGLPVEGSVHGLFLCGIGALHVGVERGARLGAGTGP